MSFILQETSHLNGLHELGFMEEMDTVTWVKILDDAVFISHSAYTIVEGINPIILSPVMADWVL